jgi:hypothetical protein
VFENSLLALPLISASDYTNIAGWIASNTNSLMWLTNILPTSGIVFTFNQSVMKTQMTSTLVLTGDLAVAASNFFTCMEAAIIASLMQVSSGSYLGSSSPATTWSAPPVSVPDPASLILAKSSAVSFMSSASLSANHPILANAVRVYLSALTYTVTGVNSLPIPTPLVSALTPVI